MRSGVDEQIPKAQGNVGWWDMQKRDEVCKSGLGGK